MNMIVLTISIGRHVLDDVASIVPFDGNEIRSLLIKMVNAIVLNIELSLNVDSKLDKCGMTDFDYCSIEAPTSNWNDYDNKATTSRQKIIKIIAKTKINFVKKNIGNKYIKKNPVIYNSVTECERFFHKLDNAITISCGISYRSQSAMLKSKNDVVQRCVVFCFLAKKLSMDRRSNIRNEYLYVYEEVHDIFAPRDGLADIVTITEADAKQYLSVIDWRGASYDVHKRLLPV